MEELELEELEKKKKLSAAHEVFCQEYISCLNQSLAYSRAYPNAKPQNCRKLASRLMTNEDIQTRIKELQEERAKRYQITSDFLIEKSIWVINKAQEGNDEVILDTYGDVVKT